MDNWFSEWFASEEYLDVYNHRDGNDAKKLVKLILQNISLPENASILDAACGPGRYLKEFAELGFRVFGFDLSLPLLSIAAKKAVKYNLQFNLVNSDLRIAYFKKQFNLIINLFTSFGYFFRDEENFSFVKNSYEMLDKNGYFVFDYFNKNFVINNLVPESERIINDKRITEKRLIKDNRVVKKMMIHTNDYTKNFVESVGLYTCDEIISGFGAAGYKVSSVFGNYEGDNFDNYNSERLIIIFTK